MADYAWPSLSIPPDFLIGTSVAYRGDNIIRQQMDAGPAKVRLRYNAPSVQINASLILTDHQFFQLTRFMTDVGVVNTFTIETPYFDIQMEFRFLELPKAVLLCGGEHADLDDVNASVEPGPQRKWAVTFVLETI